MNIETFEFKKNDPLIAKNVFGTIGGYYLETLVDKSGIWIKFVRTLEKQNSNAFYTRKIDEVSKATVEEVIKTNA